MKTWDLQLKATNDNQEMICSMLVEGDDKDQAYMTGYVAMTTMLDMEVCVVEPAGMVEFDE